MTSSSPRRRSSMSDTGRAVFLERDGVLNDQVAGPGGKRPPWSLTEIRLNSEALTAVRTLRRLGFNLVIITNQPEIARGNVSAETVRLINEVIGESLGIESAYFCPHDESDGCACRKPKPG